MKLRVLASARSRSSINEELRARGWSRFDAMGIWTPSEATCITFSLDFEVGMEGWSWLAFCYEFCMKRTAEIGSCSILRMVIFKSIYWIGVRTNGQAYILHVLCFL